MPAQGRGANLDTSRRITGVRRPAPKPSTAPVAQVPGPTNLTSLSSEPFKPAQQQAARKVVSTQRALPAQPTPKIPRIHNPTPAQTVAALQIAHRSQTQALGPKPTAAKIRSYQQELANDPRQREYLQTVAHYVKAQEAHQAELVGRITAGGGENVEAALSPEGHALSRADAEAIGRQVLARKGATASKAPAPKNVALPLFGLATIRVPGTAKLGGDIATALSKLAPGLSGNTPEESFARNLGKDALGIGELPFVGGYEVANAGVHAAGGDLAPASKLASGVAQGLEHGAAGELVQGHLSGAERAVREHPLYSALEALGATGVAGRSAGAIARGAGSDVADSGLRGALARAGSQVRPPIALADDAGAARQGLVRQRTYSPDLIRKAAQVISDKRRGAVLDEHGQPVTIGDRGRTVSVLKPSAREQEKLAGKRANFEAARTQAVEHVEREDVRKAMVKAVPGRSPRNNVGGALGRELTHLVATGTIKGVDSFRADLEKRAASIEEAVKHPENFRTAKELKAAEANAQLLRKAASDPRLEQHAPRIVAQGLQLAGELNKGDTRLADLHVHPHEELARSQLTEYALAHMDARRFTVEDHQAAEAAALAQEHAAARAVTEGPARVQEAQQGVELARKADRIRATIDLANRAGTAGEREAAVAAVERQMRSAGITDLRDVPSVHEANHILEQAQLDHGTSAAALRQARAHRMAVSGRGLPEGIAAHEDAVRSASEARQKVTQAEEGVRRAERARATQVGVHASRRGSQGLRAATDAEKAASQLAAERVQRAKADLRAAKTDAARKGDVARASKPPAIKAGLRHSDGTFLSNTEIRAHAAANGRDPDTLAYAPHVLGAGNKRAYHQPYRPGTRPAGGGEARTGTLYRRGATTIGRELVHDELASKATTANKAQALDKFTHEAGIKRPDGRYFTPAEALEASKRFEHDGESQYVPVRAFGAKLSTDTRERLKEVQSPASMETAHLALLNDRVITEGDKSGTRNAVLVPRHLFDALERQLKPASELEKSAQMLNAPFRMAVLPQPRWLTGNFLEPYFVRLPLSGAGINLPGAAMDVIAGRKALKAMENSGDAAQVRAAKEIRAQQFGGLFVGKRGASVRRSYQDFSGDEARALYAAHVVRNLPVLKQLGDMVLSLPHAFFHVNRVIESQAQHQAFGRSVRRDVQQFTGKWSQSVLLGKRALADVGKGLVDTPAQHRFMESQHELLGQYDSFNPRMRKLVQTVAPFLPWTLASMRFVFWTLPAHHTVAFTALMKAAQSVQTEWEQQHADVPPGTLKDAIVRKDGGLVDLERYTPYGATSPVVQGDLSGLTDTVGPQLSGSVKALEGQDPFGRELQVPKTPDNPEGKASGAQKLGIAGYSALESLVPLLAQARRLREGGGTAYANSTIVSPKVKPNTSHMSALERTLSPIRPTYLKQPATTGAGASPREKRAIQRIEKRSSFNSARMQRAIARSEGK